MPKQVRKDLWPVPITGRDRGRDEFTGRPSKTFIRGFVQLSEKAHQKNEAGNQKMKETAMQQARDIRWQSDIKASFDRQQQGKPMRRWHKALDSRRDSYNYWQGSDYDYGRERQARRGPPTRKYHPTPKDRTWIRDYKDDSPQAEEGDRQRAKVIGYYLGNISKAKELKKEGDEFFNSESGKSMVKKLEGIRKSGRKDTEELGKVVGYHKDQIRRSRDLKIEAHNYFHSDRGRKIVKEMGEDGMREFRLFDDYIRMMGR